MNSLVTLPSHELPSRADRGVSASQPDLSELSLPDLRVVAVSDTHGNFSTLRVPCGDVFVHAGDFTMSESDAGEVAAFLKWVRALPHRHKILVPGNHDPLFQGDTSLVARHLGRTHLLVDRSVTIDGVVFYGTPWSRVPGSRAFYLPDADEGQQKWREIPENVDVLISHAPAHGVLDFDRKAARHVGEVGLRDRVDQIKPAVHICGHVHDGAGESSNHGVFAINCAVVDRRLCPVRGPRVVDLTGVRLRAGTTARRPRPLAVSNR
jgi:Icc-related predicted phosphoesterase